MALQIPPHQVSNTTKVEVAASVKLEARQDAAHAGVFAVRGKLAFDPTTDDYPAGPLTFIVDLSDSLQGTFKARTVEQLATTGKHSPMAFASGRCVFGGDGAPKGLRYWITIAQNRAPDGAPQDVVGFVIYDRAGKRVAYGMGPVRSGSVVIASTAD